MNRQPLDCYDGGEWREREDLDTGTVFGFHITKKSGAWRILFTLVPDAGFIAAYTNLKMEYLIKWTELTADVDVPDLPSQHHQLLVYWTNMLICIEMGDTESAANWKSLIDKSLGNLKKKQVHRTGRPKRVYPRPCITVSGRSHNAKDYNL